MLPRKINFIEFSKVKIITVNNVEYENGMIKAVVTTIQFDRLTTRPYEFDLLHWAEIVERGWIE